MKKKYTNDRQIVNGYYVADVIHGFFGDQDEGAYVLAYMGLPAYELPFSVATFLQNGSIQWKDARGCTASMSFSVKPDQIEFFATYCGQKKSMRMFREWGEYEDAEKIARLESEAIGNLCMMCIYEKLPN